MKRSLIGALLIALVLSGCSLTQDKNVTT
ncbi:lipoprotein [Candidatus Arthromitus sp. SFB-turkey]|nr:lipoprotein [Candidatus Dwaynia gallinarum]